MHNNMNVNVSGPVQPTATYKTKVLKGNHSFASQVTEPNMKYVIKHDFDLGGESVEIPEGCLLEFDGGSISNGTLVGQSTILIYNQPLNDILTATLEGTWRHESGVKADEEDITDLNGELKFKDKDYAPADYSGLGRKILRKNIVNDVNTLTQSMINDTNTIYVIQYDYTLATDITIPANCVLEFDGGSISGEHTITGTNTGIQAGLVKIFSTDVTLTGTWNVAEAYPEWFGAKGDGVTDDRLSIQKSLNHFYKVVLGKKRYHIESFTDTENKVCINVPSERIFMGSSEPTEGRDTTNIDVSTSIAPKIVIKLNSKVHIEYIGVDCNIEDPLNNEANTAAFSSGVEFAEKITVRRCFGLYAYYGFNLCTYNSIIENNYAAGDAIGFFIHGKINSSEQIIGDNWATSIVYEKNYADFCGLIGHKLYYIVYSVVMSNAADHCGYTNQSSPVITTGGSCYRFYALRGCTINSNGCEQSFFALYARGLEYCELKQLDIYCNNYINTAYGDDNKYIIHFEDCTQNDIENIRVMGSIENKTGRIRIEANTANIATIIKNPYFPGLTESTLKLAGYAANGNVNEYRNGIVTNELKRGTTENRPLTVGRHINVGLSYSDTTLNKPIWWNAFNWVDATGTTV